jgi:hypothetical protein
VRCCVRRKATAVCSVRMARCRVPQSSNRIPAAVMRTLRLMALLAVMGSTSSSGSDASSHRGWRCTWLEAPVITEEHGPTCGGTVHCRHDRMLFPTPQVHKVTCPTQLGICDPTACFLHSMGRKSRVPMLAWVAEWSARRRRTGNLETLGICGAAARGRSTTRSIVVYTVSRQPRFRQPEAATESGPIECLRPDRA